MRKKVGLLLITWILMNLGAQSTNAETECNLSTYAIQSSITNSTLLTQSISTLTSSTTPDLTLLSTVASAFWQRDRYETESQILMTMRSGGGDVKISAKIKTIAQTGDKFIAQLAFAPPGVKAKVNYIITSNGRKVWIYRPDRRQYAETTLTQFKSSSNSFWIGTYSLLFISITEARRLDILSSLGTERDFINFMTQSGSSGLTGSEQQIDGLNLYTYSAPITKENMQASFSVYPENGTIQRFEFTSKTQGVNISFLEKLINRTPQVNISQRTFTFVPPKGVKKVKIVAIDPLNV
jgi:outer membrane lipoprotein-sorting protein